MPCCLAYLLCSSVSSFHLSQSAFYGEAASSWRQTMSGPDLASYIVLTGDQICPKAFCDQPPWIPSPSSPSPSCPSYPNPLLLPETCNHPDICGKDSLPVSSPPHHLSVHFPVHVCLRALQSSGHSSYKRIHAVDQDFHGWQSDCPYCRFPALVMAGCVMQTCTMLHAVWGIGFGTALSSGRPSLWPLRWCLQPL